MVKRYIPCARVSTRDQSDNGTSLESQVEACVSYIERIGGVALAPIVEDISGVMPLSERPGGRRILELLDKGEADGVVWYTCDRFFRDDLEARIQCRQWLKAGIELHLVESGQVKSESDIVFLLRTWQASDEREKIRERTSRGRNTKAKAGKVVHGGKPPFGYRKQDSSLQIVEEQAEVVRMIYTWYVLGDETGQLLTIRGIAHRLTVDEVPTPYAGHSVRRNRAPTAWNGTAVRFILANETYVGLLRYGKEIGRNTGKFRGPEDQIAITVPPIVDRELWEAAQSRRQYNKRMASRNAKHEFLLRGMVKCKCGYSLVAYKPTRLNDSYYHCGGEVHSFKEVEGKRCDQKPVRGSWLEGLVWEHVIGLLKDEVTLKKHIRLAQEQEVASLQPRQDALKEIEVKLKELEIEAANIAQHLARVKSGAVSDALQKRMEEIDTQYAAYSGKQKTIAASLSQLTYTEENICFALEFARRVGKGIENPTFEMKRRTLEMMQTSVTVNGQVARVETKIPVSDVTLEIAALGSLNHNKTPFIDLIAVYLLPETTRGGRPPIPGSPPISARILDLRANVAGLGDVADPDSPPPSA
jgi:site-specific DNA recombinase